MVVREAPAMTPRDVTLRINERTYTRRCEPRKTLADFIREDCGLTGTHLGCEHGVCGACTILMNGEPVRACLLFAVQAAGADLMTVEGLAHGDRLHPIQQAYWEHHALQCGFCTPGFLMTTLAFLRDHPRPTDREIREGLAGNLCRCTGYQNIVKAVAAAAETLAAGGQEEFFPALVRLRGVAAVAEAPGVMPAGRRATRGARTVRRARSAGPTEGDVAPAAKKGARGRRRRARNRRGRA